MRAKVIAISGGKDSTAMALGLSEKGEDGCTLLFTPTGNELGDVLSHIKRVSEITSYPLAVPDNHSLEYWIDHYGALPNWRQRWCTRLIKIQPASGYLLAAAAETGEKPILFVGLRADELERQGLYGEYAEYRYPLREWGFGIEEVITFCLERGMSPPKRTDCAVCPYQRLGEWWDLWRDHPEEYAKGEAWEKDTGHTFRSPGRDSWPAGLLELRLEFEKGKVPRGASVQGTLFDQQACRVCKF